MKKPDSNNQPQKPSGPGDKTGQVIFVRFFKHWRSGKIMDAYDYGYKAWPLGPKK